MVRQVCFMAHCILKECYSHPADPALYVCGIVTAFTMLSSSVGQPHLLCCCDQSRGKKSFSGPGANDDVRIYWPNPEPCATVVALEYCCIIRCICGKSHNQFPFSISLDCEAGTTATPRRAEKSCSNHKPSELQPCYYCIDIILVVLH